MIDPAPVPETLGDHDVVGRIGRGGAGYVLEVRNRQTRVAYAAKLIIRASDPLARERFRREAELLARCDRHPGIVKVHSFGEAPDGNLYLIMDLVRGEGLDRLLEREERLAPLRAAALGRDVALALGHAHALGIVHRDVKPSNVLLDEAGGARLTDFGLATACDLETLTRTGVFLGTVRYCAPEQALAGAIGPAADVFAAGCLLFHALTGRAPLEHLATPMEVFRELAAPTPLPDVRSVEPSCPEPLARIVARALEKAPGDRYASGSELAADLSRFLEGRGILDAGTAPRRGVARRAILAALTLALAGALAVAGRELARTIRARDELSASRTLLASASSILGRRTGAPTYAELVFALEASRRAGERALEAASLGATGAGEAGSLATTSFGLAAAALARRELALGDAAAALVLLEAVPEVPGAIAADQSLDRARALFLLGRLDAREAEAVAELPLGPRRAEALELLGDILRVQHEPTRAESAYTAALDLAASRQRELRRKRGGAAALVEDDKLALADLAVLVPDLAQLPASRAANEPLAELAPALYRRALAASLEACERDLELASRIAAAPPELERQVGARWLALAEAEGKRWLSQGLVDQTEEAMLGGRRTARLFAHARETGSTDSEVRWTGAEVFWGWCRTKDPPVVERVARALLAEDPDDFVLKFIIAYHAAFEPRRRGEAIRLCEAAVDGMARDWVATHRMARTFVYQLSFLMAHLLAAEKRELDEDRLRRLAATTRPTDYWFFAAKYFSDRDEPGRALETLDRMPPGAPGSCVLPEALVPFHAVLLAKSDRLEEARALARSADPAIGQAVTERLVAQCRLWEEGFSADSRASRDDVVRAGKTYVLLGRLVDAEADLRVLRAVDDPRAADLAAAIERARAPAGK
jgi:serine/threonine-protein kinase